MKISSKDIGKEGSVLTQIWVIVTERISNKLNSCPKKENRKKEGGLENSKD